MGRPTLGSDKRINISSQNTGIREDVRTHFPVRTEGPCQPEKPTSTLMTFPHDGPLFHSSVSTSVSFRRCSQTTTRSLVHSFGRLEMYVVPIDLLVNH